VLPTEELFVYVYVLIHDLMLGGAIVVLDRPGPTGACTDAELLAIAIVRHWLGRRSEAGFLAEVARDWGHLFPRLPHQSETNRRTRWLWGAFEQIRITLAARLPEDDCQQVDTSALPVKHPSRVRGQDRLQLPGPGGDLLVGGQDLARGQLATHQRGVAGVLDPPLHPGILRRLLAAFLRPPWPSASSWTRSPSAPCWFRPWWRCSGGWACGRATTSSGSPRRRRHRRRCGPAISPDRPAPARPARPARTRRRSSPR